MTRSPLGRGLSALLEKSKQDNRNEDQAPDQGGIKNVSTALLTGGKFQPRKYFNTEELQELSKSIAQKGVLQPILVRPLKQSVHPYEIIAGERRWQAAKMAQLKTVPVIVCDLTDQETLEVALIENLQRADLNALEEAEGYKNLIDKFNYSHQMISESVGKSRSQISNTLRLLSLPENVKDLIRKKVLTAGHARALLTAENAEKLSEEIVKDNLSVREVEKRTSLQKKPSSLKRGESENSDLVYLEQELRQKIGVNLDLKEKSGKIILTASFSNFEKLDQFIEKVCQ